MLLEIRNQGAAISMLHGDDASVHGDVSDSNNNFILFEDSI